MPGDNDAEHVERDPRRAAAAVELVHRRRLGRQDEGALRRRRLFYRRLLLGRRIDPTGVEECRRGVWGSAAKVVRAEEARERLL